VEKFESKKSKVKLLSFSGDESYHISLEDEATMLKLAADFDNPPTKEQSHEISASPPTHGLTVTGVPFKGNVYDISPADEDAMTELAAGLEDSSFEHAQNFQTPAEPSRSTVTGEPFTLTCPHTENDCKHYFALQFMRSYSATSDGLMVAFGLDPLSKTTRCFNYDILRLAMTSDGRPATLCAVLEDYLNDKARSVS